MTISQHLEFKVKIQNDPNKQIITTTESPVPWSDLNFPKVCSKILLDSSTLQRFLSAIPYAAKQEGILYAHASIWSIHRGIFCELFTYTTSICRLFSEAEWRILGAKFHKRVLLDESEFIVAFLSPLRGQSFLS